jgi:hypothetical protein
VTRRCVFRRLLLLLNGDAIAALDRHHATIVTRTGVRRTFRCRPVDSDRVAPIRAMAEPLTMPRPPNAA